MTPDWLKYMSDKSYADYKTVCKSLGISLDSLKYKVKAGIFPEPNVTNTVGFDLKSRRVGWDKAVLLKYYRSM